MCKSETQSCHLKLILNQSSRKYVSSTQGNNLSDSLLSSLFSLPFSTPILQSFSRSLFLSKTNSFISFQSLLCMRSILRLAWHRRRKLNFCTELQIFRFLHRKFLHKTPYFSARDISDDISKWTRLTFMFIVFEFSTDKTAAFTNVKSLIKWPSKNLKLYVLLKSCDNSEKIYWCASGRLKLIFYELLSEAQRILILLCPHRQMMMIVMKWAPWVYGTHTLAWTMPTKSSLSQSLATFWHA